MDDLLPELLAFPPHPPPPNPLTDKQYEDAALQHIESVKKMSQTKMLQQTSGGEHALDVIDPAMNSISYVFLLTATIGVLKKGGKGVDADFVFQKLSGFLSVYDPRQIRYVGKEFTEVIECVAHIATSSQSPALAISPIADALLRLDPSGAMMTSHHNILVNLALESRDFQAVTPVLDNFILYFPGVTNQPKPKYICDMSLNPTAYITTERNLTQRLKSLDVLEYFFNAGLIYLGLRQWQKAFDILECAVIYPVKEGVSKIMVEAYKKWVLAGLMLDGKLAPLPRSTSSLAAKNYHVLAKPYEILAQIFENGSASRLKSEADFGHSIWNADQNMGLILHVLAAYQKFQIRHLADVYSKISIPEAYNQTTSAETGAKLPSIQAADTLVREMISSGELAATISSPTSGASILTFTTATLLTETDMACELALAAQRIHALTKEIKQTDRMLTHDKEYIKYVQKHKKIAKSSGNGGNSDHGIAGTDMEWNDIIEDEDIMGVY